jgi:hypothetical protein
VYAGQSYVAILRASMDGCKCCGSILRKSIVYALTVVILLWMLMDGRVADTGYGASQGSRVEQDVGVD